MSSVRLIDTWRTTIFRLVLLYGILFSAGVIAILVLIYYKTADYIDRQTDLVLTSELQRYQLTPTSNLVELIRRDIGRDARHIEVYGLFAADGTLLTGNLKRIPPTLPKDGMPYSIKIDASVIDDVHATSIRALQASLPNGNTVVVGREERQLEEIQNNIFEALGGTVFIILVGTTLGVYLSLTPIRRIREIQDISEQIISGDIGLRLPVSGQDDELDLLAKIVNRMLDEIEQRMFDIKGASDNIAHNLSTPLTRLRATLSRLRQSPTGDANHNLSIDQAIEEVDRLLFRFRALLRISEISGSTRRMAFEHIDLRPILRNVEEVYAPLAEEKNLQLNFTLPEASVDIFGDGALLFEAILNLVDNAIKFTPPGGHVDVRLRMDPHAPCVEVADTGPGIPEKDINMVKKSFYRSDASRLLPGSGVGLSIVSAIVRLHGFHFDLSSGPDGTCASIRCASSLESGGE